MPTPSQEVGTPIPDNTAHAISVTLPTWEATVGYEEGEEWVTSKMKIGYPRYFIHGSIQNLAKAIEAKFGRDGECCMIFASYNCAKRCREYIKANTKSPSATVRVLQLSTRPPATEIEKQSVVESTVGIVFFPASEFTLAKQYWTFAGEGVTSRMAEYVTKELFAEDSRDQARRASKTKQELQVESIQKKSPSISASMRTNSLGQNEEVEKEFNTFIEQKYGRVLDLKFAADAKLALKKRISGKADQSLRERLAPLEKDLAPEVSKRGIHIGEKDVLLYPTGMSAIFHAHQALLAVNDAPKKTVCFGFPYVDTLKVLQKFGPGCHFFGFGDDESLDDMEKQLEKGEISIQALFCECPSNPLLKTPDLKRIRALADKYNFAVVVDETVGNFLNISVLQYVDMVVSSLTKVFSGDSNVMGGSLILNSQSPHYSKLAAYFDLEYEDLFWAEDALYLERNSRDFELRAARIDENTALVVDYLNNHPSIKKVYYPSLLPSKKHYDAVKTKNGGYGGLLSVDFHEPQQAIKFFNCMHLHKGPSLGTNFTLACPYAVLAHYAELDEIAKWGVDKYLIRISIGLEDPNYLLQVLDKSMEESANAVSSNGSSL